MFAEALGVEKIPVLLVEDTASEATATRKRLHAIDDEFDITRVASLREALERVAKNKVDVVLLDLGLPDSFGPQSIKKISEQYPDLPIVVLSGRDDPDTIRTALEYGAQGFLSKNESSGQAIRQAIMVAIIRKSLAK